LVKQTFASRSKSTGEYNAFGHIVALVHAVNSYGTFSHNVQVSAGLAHGLDDVAAVHAMRAG